jgi:hypothetical protein
VDEDHPGERADSTNHVSGLRTDDDGSPAGGNLNHPRTPPPQGTLTTRAQQNLHASGASRTLAAPPADRSGGVKTELPQRSEEERSSQEAGSVRGAPYGCAVIGISVAPGATEIPTSASHHCGADISTRVAVLPSAAIAR